MIKHLFLILSVLTLSFFLPKIALSQSCTNWLYLPPGSNASVQIGDLDVPGTQITVEAEFCRTTAYSDTYQGGDLVSKHNDPSTVNYLLRPNLACITTDAGYFQTPAVCDAQLNITYHVAMVYDGNTLKYYRDGVLLSQIAATGNLYQQDIPTRIGLLYSQMQPEAFEGYINEVRIWNVARTQAQIQAYMSTSLPSPATQTGLLAYYTFSIALNQQGSAAWNGVLNSGALVNQTNPFCNAAALEGTLSGSNTCNGAPGMLTFHSQSGPGPFTLTYSDGVQTYTATNVMDGMPFPVQVQPTVSTTYSLISIQTSSPCPASATPVGVTATINPGNCSLCTGSLGDPVIDVTFGSGTGNSPPLETAVPGASTTLTYTAVSGTPPVPTPKDGQYTITNAVPSNDAMGPPVWYTGGADHTGNPNGYMLFENPGVITGEFFRQTVSNLCSSTKYEFAAWIANADDLNVVNAVLPDLTFIVQTTDGTVLDTYNSGPVPQLSSWTWNQYGFFFTLPAGVSTVVVRIIDNNPGGLIETGNDFAIDDITFRPCGPVMSASFSSAAATVQQTVCEGGGATLYGAVSSGYTNPQYLWQISQDSGKTWTDIPGATNLQLAVTTPITGSSIDYYYRMLAAGGNNIQSTSCRVSSNDVILSSTAIPDADFSFTQDVCNPLQANLIVNAQTGVTYTWTVNGTVFPPAAGTSPLVYAFPAYGNYPVNLTAAGALCSSTISKTITVQLQPADIIITPDTGICAGKSVTLNTQPSLAFCWSPTNYLDNPASAMPVATPPVTTKYYFTADIPGTNLIINGNFSAGNTGFTSDYTYSLSGLPASVYFTGTNPSSWNSGMPSCKDHTTGNGNMLLVNGSQQLNTRIWSETIPVQPNTNYVFSAWLESLSNLSPAILQFSINGQPIGNQLQASATTCSWNQFYTFWNSGSSSSAVISIINENQAFSGNDFALDDISFAPVTVQMDSVTVDVETPSVQAAPADTSVCPNMPFLLRATGSLNYVWSPATGLSNDSIAGPTDLPPFPPTGNFISYTVTGTSARGCTASATANITVYPRLITIGPADTLLCVGGPAQLYASGGGSYSWSPAALLDNPTSATPVASPVSTTQFNLTLIDINQCMELDSTTIRVKPVPVFLAPPAESVCDGFKVPLSSANSPGYIYSWTPSAGLSDPLAPYPEAQPRATTIYTLHISDSLCSAYDSSFDVGVTVKPSPTLRITKDNDIDCSVHTAQLRADGANTYLWQPAAGLNDPASPDPIASIDTSTSFIVQGFGVNGCYSFDTIAVRVSATGANLFVVPNAFTPNGDGHNDCFGVTHWGDVQLEEMEIYDRWGARIFTTRNPSDCWDGTFKGKPQETGAYPYVIRAYTICGIVTMTGVVMLIR